MKTGCLRCRADLASGRQVEGIAKHIFTPTNTWEASTYYVRDAQGNVMATYLHTTEEGEYDGQPVTLATYTVSERHIYGSSRLGMDTTHIELLAYEPPPADRVYTTNADARIYELTNHLGNVLATFTARKLPTTDNGEVTGFMAHVTSLSDYYPFGSALTGRMVEGSYRYGYQGSERESEISGKTGGYSTYYRFLDARLGRWFSTDPKAHLLPSQSTYISMDGNPLFHSDPMGDRIKGSRKDKKAFKEYINSIEERIGDIDNMNEQGIHSDQGTSMLQLKNDLQTQLDVAKAMIKRGRNEPVYDLSSTRIQNEMSKDDGAIGADVNINQDRSNTSRVVFNVNFNGENANSSFAYAVTIVDLYDKGDWSFKSQGGSYSDGFGAMTDMDDLEIIHRNAAGWGVDLGARDLGGEFSVIDQVVQSALNSDIFIEFRQRRAKDINAGMNPNRSIGAQQYSEGFDETGRENVGTYGQNWYEDPRQPNAKTEYRKQDGQDRLPSYSPR